MAMPKPDGPASATFSDDAAVLRTMARAMAQVKVVRRWSTGVAPMRARRRRLPSATPELIAIAASTGGPAALRRILMDLPRTFPAPILIVQHIARDFTAGFADWLAGSCALPVQLARHGEPLRNGVVCIAPDNVHLGVTPDGRTHLSHELPISGFRPSATHLFATAATYGPRLAAVVLTGMGSDGVDGLVEAHDAGAYVLAQDEASSIVFGMAGEAVRCGAVDLVLPLEQIARRLVDLVAKETHVG
jgi:two-component system chemotaxis response regulator CheB